MRGALAAIAALAACGDPPPMVLKYALSTDPSQQCMMTGTTPAATCSDVKLLCAADLSIRLFNPDGGTGIGGPMAPYISVCEPIPVGHQNLCSIAGVTLPAPTTTIPAEKLEIEVLIYRDTDLDHDAAGNPQCPSNPQFAYAGPTLLPVNQSPGPAIGGAAFYHPGDKETVVPLGCTNQVAVEDPSCAGMNTVGVTATVQDFDTEVLVPPALADQLSVLIGEPQPVAATTDYALSPTEAKPLDRTMQGPTPTWGGAVDLKLVSSVCLEVLEDGPQITPTLLCKTATAGQSQVDITGVRVSPTTLGQILTALGKTQVPPTGLVIGMVLDNLSNPVANAVVSTASGTISYLTADRKALLAGATSTNGIFLSTDAPYTSTFFAHSGMATATAFGGIVDGKVTVVLLQYATPTNQ